MNHSSLMAAALLAAACGASLGSSALAAGTAKAAAKTPAKAGSSAAAPADISSFPQVKEALSKAKEQGKPVLVLWYWTQDNAKQTARLKKEWGNVVAANMPLILAQFNESEPPADTPRDKVMPVEQYDLPCAVLLSADGAFMKALGHKQTLNGSSVVKEIGKLLPNAAKFRELQQKAISSKGEAAALAAGQALDLVNGKTAMRDHGPLRNIINREDPQDKTGYRSFYGMLHMDMYREINQRLQGGPEGKLKGGDRDFAAAEAYVDKVLENKKLQGERLQQWLSGKAYIVREKGSAGKGEVDRKPLVELYKRIAKIDPKSEHGVGAAFLAKYWDKDKFYELKNGSYEGYNQCGAMEKEWHVDMSKDMRGASAGVYTFRMIPRIDSGMTSRNFRLVINGKAAGTALNMKPETSSKTVDFQVPQIGPKDKVEVWITTRCHDGWMGTSGDFEMKKKDASAK